MREDHRDLADELFGMNLRILRERAGISQSALAAAMTKQGISWHQQTVGRVEAGQQSVRFHEARQLAAILHTSMDRFTWEGPEASETEMVYGAGAVLRQRYEAVAHAVCLLLLGQDRAERTLAQSEDSKYERVQEARRDVGERMDMYALEAAVEEGIRRYDERGTGDESGDGTRGEP